MTRPFLFGTNFKMNQTPQESVEFYVRLVAQVEPLPGVQLFIIPPFTSLPAVTTLAQRDESGIWIGAQNMHWAAEGAYTGEISATMLRALGVDLVLLGHAERRRDFHETDPDLNRKVLAALESGLRVLLAVGESAEERQFGVSAEIVLRQLKIDLHGVCAEQLSMLQIAYEPVWSIGVGGTPASPRDVAPMAALIRGAMGELYGEAGTAVPILYGGSVDPTNAASFTALEDIDGLFVGRAAWTVEGFLATYRAGLAGKLASRSMD
jgi:triosephosphate isomerase